MSAPTAGASTATAALSLEGVTVEFPHPGGGIRTVLREFSLEVPRGQFVVLVGRSGCGKTTVLNLTAGLLQPAGGVVTVLGTTPVGARGDMGFMLARDALLPWRSALGNVMYGLELRGLPKEERTARARRWLEAVHLPDSGSLWPWQLSQGMRQRVALARTWALDPALLLMDEPFAALDAQTRLSVQDEFLRLWQMDQDRTVLFVTHDLGEALALADRIVLIGPEGRIIEDVVVPFERPRNLLDLVGEPEFQRLRAKLHQGLL